MSNTKNRGWTIGPTIMIRLLARVNSKRVDKSRNDNRIDMLITYYQLDTANAAWGPIWFNG